MRRLDWEIQELTLNEIIYKFVYGINHAINKSNKYLFFTKFHVPTMFTTSSKRNDASMRRGTSRRVTTSVQ